MSPTRRYSAGVVFSPFLIPVSDLLHDSGSRRTVEFDASIAWGFELASVGPEFHADLTLENASGVLIVRGAATTAVQLTCHKCLTQWGEAVQAQVAEALGVVDDADGYSLDGDNADLEPVLRDVVLLQVPLRPLCQQGCLGLCATCGADLNTEPCLGHDEVSASPFAVLRDLLEP